jgi:hypothetical protein
MPTKILISDIKIDRDLREGDNLSDLEQLTLTRPIVVHSDGRLIDGLRRVKLAEKLGVTDLPGYRVTTLEEMSKALAEQHTTPVTDWTRVIELLKFLKPAARDRWLNIRQSTMEQNRWSGGSQETTSTRPKGPSRPFINRALGGTSAAHWEVVEKIFNTAPPELVALVRAGKLSPSGALNRMHRHPKPGSVSEPRDQENLLDSAAQAIQAAARSFDKLDWPLKVEPERLRDLREQIYKGRSKITSFLNQSEEAAK